MGFKHYFTESEQLNEGFKWWGKKSSEHSLLEVDGKQYKYWKLNEADGPAYLLESPRKRRYGLYKVNESFMVVKYGNKKIIAKPKGIFKESTDGKLLFELKGVPPGMQQITRTGPEGAQRATFGEPEVSNPGKYYLVGKSLDKDSIKTIIKNLRADTNGTIDKLMELTGNTPGKEKSTSQVTLSLRNYCGTYRLVATGTGEHANKMVLVGTPKQSFNATLGADSYDRFFILTKDTPFEATDKDSLKLFEANKKDNLKKLKQAKGVSRPQMPKPTDKGKTLKYKKEKIENKHKKDLRNMNESTLLKEFHEKQIQNEGLGKSIRNTVMGAALAGASMFGADQGAPSNVNKDNTTNSPTEQKGDITVFYKGILANSDYASPEIKKAKDKLWIKVASNIVQNTNGLSTSSAEMLFFSGLKNVAAAMASHQGIGGDKDTILQVLNKGKKDILKASGYDLSTLLEIPEAKAYLQTLAKYATEKAAEQAVK